jgi:hypothetical protein
MVWQSTSLIFGDIICACTATLFYLWLLPPILFVGVMLFSGYKLAQLIKSVRDGKALETNQEITGTNENQNHILTRTHLSVFF